MSDEHQRDGGPQQLLRPCPAASATACLEPADCICPPSPPSALSPADSDGSRSRSWRGDSASSLTPDSLESKVSAAAGVLVVADASSSEEGPPGDEDEVCISTCYRHSASEMRHGSLGASCGAPVAPSTAAVAAVADVRPAAAEEEEDPRPPPPSSSSSSAAAAAADGKVVLTSSTAAAAAAPTSTSGCSPGRPQSRSQREDYRHCDGSGCSSAWGEDLDAALGATIATLLKPVWISFLSNGSGHGSGYGCGSGSSIREPRELQHLLVSACSAYGLKGSDRRSDHDTPAKSLASVYGIWQPGSGSGVMPPFGAGARVPPLRKLSSANLAHGSRSCPVSSRPLSGSGSDSTVCDSPISPARDPLPSSCGHSKGPEVGVRCWSGLFEVPQRRRDAASLEAGAQEAGSGSGSGISNDAAAQPPSPPSQQGGATAKRRRRKKKKVKKTTVAVVPQPVPDPALHHAIQAFLVNAPWQSTGQQQGTDSGTGSESDTEADAGAGRLAAIGGEAGSDTAAGSDTRRDTAPAAVETASAASAAAGMYTSACGDSASDATAACSDTSAYAGMDMYAAAAAGMDVPTAECQVADAGMDTATDVAAPNSDPDPDPDPDPTWEQQYPVLPSKPDAKEDPDPGTDPGPSREPAQQYLVMLSASERLLAARVRCACDVLVRHPASLPQWLLCRTLAPRLPPCTRLGCSNARCTSLASTSEATLPCRWGGGECICGGSGPLKHAGGGEGCVYMGGPVLTVMRVGGSCEAGCGSVHREWGCTVQPSCPPHPSPYSLTPLLFPAPHTLPLPFHPPPILNLFRVCVCVHVCVCMCVHV